MSKGNLYTHLIPSYNSRADVLSELKQLWRSRPINHKKIRELQNILTRIEVNIKKRRPKPLKGAFDKGYQSRLAARGET